MPRLAKNIIMISPTIMTLIIAGRDANKEFTINFKPSFLLITLSGLKALRALNAFKDFKDLLLDPVPPPFMLEIMKSMKEAQTTKKSNTFQPFIK